MTPTPEMDMACPQEFGFLPDCNCPYEHWHMSGVCLDIHFEENGEVHVFMMGEDWERETTLADIPDLETARPLAFAWAKEILQ